MLHDSINLIDLKSLTAKKRSEALCAWKTRLAKLHEWRDKLTKEAFLTAFAELLEISSEHDEKDVKSAIGELGFLDLDVRKAWAIVFTGKEVRESFTLSVEHLVALANEADDKKRLVWAHRAVKDGLSSSELKQSIKSGMIVRKEVREREAGNQSGQKTIQGIIQLDFQRWLNQVGGHEGIKQMDLKNKLLLRKAFDPVCDVVDLLDAGLGLN